MILDRGFITNIRKFDDNTIVEITSSYNKHLTSFHISKCRTFFPKIGDFVCIIDDDEDWYVIKDS